MILKCTPDSVHSRPRSISGILTDTLISCSNTSAYRQATACLERPSHAFLYTNLDFTFHWHISLDMVSFHLLASARSGVSLVFFPEFGVLRFPARQPNPSVCGSAKHHVVGH